MIELSTAAGLGTAALDFIIQDPRTEKRFWDFLEKTSGTPIPARERQVLRCAQYACAGLSRLLAEEHAEMQACTA